MIDPTRHRQLQELNLVNVCTEILYNSRNELYMNMRFLDISLSSLQFTADTGCRGMGTDGFVIYYHPEYLCDLYKKSRILVNRSYLHLVLHCLFCHLDTRGKRAPEYWNLACDIAMESIIDSMYQKCIYIAPNPYRRDIYLRLRKELKVLTAEGVYKVLQKWEMEEPRFNRMAAEFCIDDHKYWYQKDSGQKSQPRKNKWDNNREKMQTEMETFANKASDDSGDLIEQVRIENRERYDYKKFLRKFAVLKEEVQVDPDSFDYVFYTYGLELYGNMPLIEPQETREMYRVEDFVIVIDTSMSCSGDLVRRFLEETYSVLAESESYFRKINIHIIQCDDKVQDDHIITSQEDMDEYMENFTIMGHGGTDFRPAFEYVNSLVLQQRFHKLRGLIYFTDGEGIFPVKKPVYETAFVFIKDNYTDLSVPPWAIKLILEPGDLARQEEEELTDDWGGQVILTEGGEREM
ncbi:VWA-like domain-containing protein [Clostridium sp. AM58-1XD]|uniref:vWA domain-containing protein n=1 Tax=Clostridium sp. AM58-1XD TaxID=2292307 RepID=UPI000E54E93B|nr:VWA-like domain-containing protein [Clostridium sp. AM58-1XD]RGZ00086.1 metallopeptidase [Clostridium sp. AM58-1XD]